MLRGGLAHSACTVVVAEGSTVGVDVAVGEAVEVATVGVDVAVAAEVGVEVASVVSVVGVGVGVRVDSSSDTTIMT